ncbi:MAG: glycosyltransferase family 2 protein [Candidatus Caldarchaeum sp.]
MNCEFPHKEREPYFAVITVTYNSEQTIQRFLNSLLEQTYDNFEIIVVDNNSRDATLRILAEFVNKQQRRRIKIIRNNKNIGYGSAVNLAVKSLREESMVTHLLICNPDGFFDKMALAHLAKWIKESDDVGIIQCKVLYASESRTINTVGNISDRFGFVKLRGEGEIDQGQFDSASSNFFYASGAAFVIDRFLFEQVDGFDDIYFLYADDFDLSWRVRLRGKQIRLAADSVFYHEGSFSFRKAKFHPTKYYYTVRNTIITMVKNYQLLNVAIYLPLAVILHCLASLYLSFLFRQANYIKAYFASLVFIVTKLRIIYSKRLTVQRRFRRQNARDKEIMRYMASYPLFVTYMRDLL